MTSPAPSTGESYAECRRFSRCSRVPERATAGADPVRLLRI